MEVSSRLRGAALTALGILVALGLVAIASRGEPPADEVGNRHAGDAVLDILFALYLLGIVAGGALFLYAVLLKRKLDRTGVTPRRSVLQSVLGMTLLFSFAFLAARRLADYQRPAPPEETLRIIPGDTIPQVTTTGREIAPDPPFAWVPVIVTISLLVLAVAAWWWSDRRRRGARGELGEPLLAAALATAVDESLDDLRAEPDPRKAVIAAYARLELVLARHGLPRKSSEAPLEYLTRMLAEVEVTAPAARRLTALFERAKFSEHEVGAEMKAEAIEALETVRDDLRAAAAAAEHERQQVVGMARAGAKS